MQTEVKKPKERDTLKKICVVTVVLITSVILAKLFVTCFLVKGQRNILVEKKGISISIP